MTNTQLELAGLWIVAVVAVALAFVWWDDEEGDK